MVLPYISHILGRVGFLRRFSLKMVKEFAHFDLESGILFEGSTVVYGHIANWF